MFYIGIDLAWAEKNETGIVMLDAHGRIVTRVLEGLYHQRRGITAVKLMA